VEPLLKQLGAWDALLAQGFHRHRGIWRESEGRSRVFEPYGRDEHGPWLGFQVDRCRLHEILRTQVAALGGQIIHVARLDGLLKTGAVVSGVRADGRDYAARHVLDASGRHAWMAEQLGLRAEKRGKENRVRFGWTNETHPELEGQPLFRKRSDGWDWIAPLGDGRCAWAKLRSVSTGGGVDHTWRIYRECAGPGYCLLGDAACLLDPSAANGVLRAIMSGIHAVHLIAAGGEGARGPLQAADEYQRWIGEMFDRSTDGLEKALHESDRIVAAHPVFPHRVQPPAMPAFHLPPAGLDDFSRRPVLANTPFTT
jgi:flavin-dependent dehydrogenase